MKEYKSQLPQITLKYNPCDIKKVKITSSIDMFDVMKKMFNPDTVEYSEETIVLFLDSGNKTIGWMKHTTGGTSQTIVDVKIILVTALQCGANAIAFAHNHPSGQLFPSREDEKVTEKIKCGCDAIGVRLLDHLIIPGDYGGYYSFCDEGKV